MAWGLFGVLLVAPSEALHVAKGALAGLVAAVAGQLLLQSAVGVALRLYAVQEGQHGGLVGQLAQRIVYEGTVRLVNVDVVVVGAKQLLGVGEAEALPHDIAQVCLCQTVLQAGHHLWGIVHGVRLVHGCQQAVHAVVEEGGGSEAHQLSLAAQQAVERNGHGNVGG